MEAAPEIEWEVSRLTPENIMEGDFLEDVLKVFAIEATDWIRLSKSALVALESASPQERVRLYEGLLGNLTNMKGSAATINLPFIDELAFSLIAVLQELQEKPVTVPGKQHAALDKGVAALSTVITLLRIAEKKAAIIGEIESMARQEIQAVHSLLKKLMSPPLRPARLSCKSKIFENYTATERLKSLPCIRCRSLCMRGKWLRWWGRQGAGRRPCFR